MHVDDDGTTLSHIINDLNDEFLSPAESTSEGVGLGYYELSVFIGNIDDGHAFLLDPNLTELTDADSRILLVEGFNQVFPGSILEIMLLDEAAQAFLHLCRLHDAL